MKRLALIGHPITHSLSPELFLAAYSKTPEIAAKYRYNLIEQNSFEKAIEVIEREQYHAFNVTAPFKQDALALANNHEQSVKEADASNLLIRSDRGFTAYNTDYWGVRQMLSVRLSENRRERVKVIVIGCGGAGRAAAIAAKDSGIETFVSNRDNEKCSLFCQKNKLESVKYENLAQTLNLFDIIIYTLPTHTSVINNIAQSKIVIEANYKDPSINKTGYEWLYWQALSGFLLMTGAEPDRESMISFLGI